MEVNNTDVFPGKLIEIDFENRQVEAIVIDPNGLGEGKPTVGLGLRMTERHMGIDHSVLSRWTSHSGADKICTTLKAPSGKAFPLVRIIDETNNEQLVIEASNWMDLAVDVLKKPGKLRKETQDKLIDFLAWFAAKGFYSGCYTKLLGVYTSSDDQSVSKLIQEKKQLEIELECLSNEYALLEHRYDRQRYTIDELQRDMSWHRSNSWGGADS